MKTTVIGRYQVIEQIGRGGMARVYRAYDPHFERLVAIKVMTMDLVDDPIQLSRFKREAKTIAALEHPAIVPVYDYGEENNRPYIVMRLITGGTLAGRLKEGPLSLEATVDIVNRIGSALDRAHEKGIIHRDLKPTNIMFDEYDDAYLADFGIARITQSARTLTGDALVGTPAYMSPEQIHGDREVDARSDIYALGAVCFEMLTGRRPYGQDRSAKVMMSHVLEPVPDIREVNPALPEGTEQVVFRTMAKRPEERYATAGAVAAALANVLQTATGRSTGVARPVSAGEAVGQETKSPDPDTEVAREPTDVRPDHPATEVMPPSFVGRRPPEAAYEMEAAAPAAAKDRASGRGCMRKVSLLILTVLLGFVAAILLVVWIAGGSDSDRKEEPAMRTSGVMVVDNQATETQAASVQTAEVTALSEDAGATDTAQMALTAEAQQEVTATAEAVIALQEAQKSTATAEAQAIMAAEAQATEEVQQTFRATAEANATARVREKILAVVSATQTEEPIFGPQSGTMAHNDDEAIEIVPADVDVRDFVAEAHFITDREGAEAGNRDFGFFFRRAGADFYWLFVGLDGYWEAGLADQNWKYTTIEDGRLTNLNTDGTPNEVIIYALGDEGLFIVNGQFVSNLDLSLAETGGDVQILTGAYMGNEEPGQETGYEAFAVWRID